MGLGFMGFGDCILEFRRFKGLAVSNKYVGLGLRVPGISQTRVPFGRNFD